MRVMRADPRYSGRTRKPLPALSRMWMVHPFREGNTPPVVISIFQICNKVCYLTIFLSSETDEAESRRHTRDERAWDGASQDEMRDVDWAAEGAPNGTAQ